MEADVKGLGKIVASEDTLCEIEMCLLDSVILNSTKGQTPLAIIRMESFKSIHNALADAGFYKAINKR